MALFSPKPSRMIEDVRLRLDAVRTSEGEDPGEDREEEEEEEAMEAPDEEKTEAESAIFDSRNGLRNRTGALGVRATFLFLVSAYSSRGRCKCEGARVGGASERARACGTASK